MGRPSALLLAAVAVSAMSAMSVAVAGCAAPVAGTSVPEASAAKDAGAPLTGQIALGDLPTIDYCSLLIPLTLPDELGQLVLLPRPAYDYCAFTVRTKGIDVGVTVGVVDEGDPPGGARRTPDPDRTLPRGLRAQRVREAPDHCTRYLTFTDSVSIMIQADSTVGEHPGHVDSCPIVEATLSVVVDRVLGKRVKHYDFAANSAGRLDACDLLSASALAARLGVPRMQTEHWASTHTCRWSAVGGAGPVVRLSIAPVDSSFDLEHTKQETIAGSATYVTPNNTRPDFPACQLETTAADSPQLGARELVLLEVGLPGKGNDACGPGRALAAEVWPKLPR
ncbi:MAG: hypothetical protein ACJ72N_10310 [Labedaea sp.]